MAPLPSAMIIALGKGAEQAIAQALVCWVQWLKHSANMAPLPSAGQDTQTNEWCRAPPFTHLPSVKAISDTRRFPANVCRVPFLTLLETICRVPEEKHSPKASLL